MMLSNVLVMLSEHIGHKRPICTRSGFAQNESGAFYTLRSRLQEQTTVMGKNRIICLLLLLPVLGEAHERHAEVLEELVVYGRAEESVGTAQSASEGLVGYDDLQLQPLLRVGELLESVPGMVATQHSGSGKANQYFLRGFNLDHGTDFSAHVEGVPINFRTHGHGQGYLDLNFLIPEMVETLTYHKGPYFANNGDFSSAGSVDFDYYDQLEESQAKLTIGENQFYRAMVAGSAEMGAGIFTGALETTAYGGPWELDEDLEQYRLFASYGFAVGESRAKLSFHGYDSRWNSTDQIPRRAVRSGLIDANGFIDPDLGGSTHRYALTASIQNRHLSASVYALDYDFSLFSNFTYFLEDPLAGDEFEQLDNRQVYGAEVHGSASSQWGERSLEYRWGVDFRYDNIKQVGLYQTRSRNRLNTIRQDSVDEWSLGGFAEVEVPITDKWRATAGLRADYFDWQVGAFRTANSGQGNDTLITPNLSMAYRFTKTFEGYANWGRGFHSNDVRGATIAVDPISGSAVDPVDALVKSQGAELGMRWEIARHFNASIAAFWLELDSELVFVGDAGFTEPNEGSRRKGVEVNAFWQATRWLALNAMYAATDAEFKRVTGGGREIPGAVDDSFSFGANAAWENGLTGSLKVRYLGGSPLVEDGSVRADDSLLVNAGMAYRFGDFEVRLDAFNLLDSDDDDIAYFYASRLAGEPAGGVEDVHFHPLEPRTFRATVTMHW